MLLGFSGDLNSLVEFLFPFLSFIFSKSLGPPNPPFQLFGHFCFFVDIAGPITSAYRTWLGFSGTPNPLWNLYSPSHFSFSLNPLDPRNLTGFYKVLSAIPRGYIAVSEILRINSRIPIARKIHWTVSQFWSLSRLRTRFQRQGSQSYRRTRSFSMLGMVARMLPMSSRASGFLWRRIGLSDRNVFFFLYPEVMRLLYQSIILYNISDQIYSDLTWPHPKT